MAHITRNPPADLIKLQTNNKKMVLDLFERLHSDIVTKALVNEVSLVRTMDVFMHSYEQHKAQHGSFRNHPEYADAMKGRYQYMYDKAIAYITSEVERRERK